MLDITKKFTDIVHDILKDEIKDGYIAIDATVGNGRDAELLCNLVGSSGHVYGFDIQQTAIERAANRLQAYTNATLINDSHSNIGSYDIPKIDAAVFNLGYLPSADKSISTSSKTTLAALNEILKRLSAGGIITIICYYGHEGGLEEKECLMQFLSALPREFTVAKIDFINRPSNPPIIFIVRR